jgi:hypothetical protein
MLTIPSTAAPPTGRRINDWRIVSLDATEKRATAQCVVCGAVRVVATGELHRTNCDCRPPSGAMRRAIREDQTQRRARRERDWRPQR